MFNLYNFETIFLNFKDSISTSLNSVKLKINFSVSKNTKKKLLNFFAFFSQLIWIILNKLKKSYLFIKFVIKTFKTKTHFYSQTSKLSSMLIQKA